MKNSILKWCMLALLMVSNVAVFAQAGGGGNGNQGGGTVEEPDAPINSKLIFLAIAGVIFAYHFFAKTQKQRQQA